MGGYHTWGRHTLTDIGLTLTGIGQPFGFNTTLVVLQGNEICPRIINSQRTLTTYTFVNLIII